MDLGDTLAFRVAARYLRAKSFGDPKMLLARFQATLDKYSLPEKDLRETRELLRGSVWDPNNQEHKKAKILAYEAARNVSNGSSELAGVGQPLFLSILQSYSLQPLLRKKIEAAAKTYAKAYRPRQKEKSFQGIYAEYIEQYEAYFSAAEQHLAAAREALKEGKEHSETPAENTTEVATKMKVGDFTLVNTGGFPEKTMNEVADLTQKASALLHSSGFGKVCYGNLLVTNSLKANKVLAFYMLAEDELLVRANFKNERDTLRTILHELGHRYQFQFMKGRDAEVKTFYRWMEGEEVDRLKDKRDELLPKKGDTIEIKGVTWEAMFNIPSSGRSGVKYTVHTRMRDEPQVTGRIDLEGWLAIKGVKLRDFNDQTLRGFVTEYAKRGGPDENFAEVFSIYCLGKLRNDYKEAFEALAFGRSKTADENQDWWGPAVDELNKFNSSYAKVQRKPQDAKTLQSAVTSIDRGTLFSVWVKKCLDPSTYADLLRVSKKVHQAVKSKDQSEEALLSLVNEYKAVAESALKTSAPAIFDYSGFKVSNPQHLSDIKCRTALEGIDYLKALFKKRGVSVVLDEGITRINLTLDEGATAFFHSGTKELTLSVNRLATGTGRFIQWVNETFLHEIGHYIHRVYLAPEAKMFWDTPWDDQGMGSLADPNYRAPKDRDEKLKDLELVTEYGKVDKYEDFAETFLVFMAAPEKLTPTAKYRMQRALSLSGLYGKPVMKLAEEDPVVSAVVSRVKQSTRMIKFDPNVVSQVLSNFRSWLTRLLQSYSEDTPANEVGESDWDFLYMTRLQTPWATGRTVMITFLPGSGTGGGMGLLQGNPVVKVFFNGGYHLKSLLEPAVLNPMALALKHELTHALDHFEEGFIGQGGKSIDVTELGELGVSPKEYFNDPMEVRAYLRQIYEEIQPSVQSMMNTPMRDKWGLGLIITKMLQARSPSWNMAEPHLTPNNRNKILKGLTTEFSGLY